MEHRGNIWKKRAGGMSDGYDTGRIHAAGDKCGNNV